MTEMETIKRAKLYMEKLANGINPIDDSVIPDEDVVNNVRLSRCFFYISGILGQIIDNGGIGEPPKKKKVPFTLSLEEKASFKPSSEPIPVSKLAKQIGALSNRENMEALRYTVIQNWLLSIGMLEETLDGNGKKAKRPTAEGERIGITLEARTGAQGMYFVVIYNQMAQHFVVDNLDAAVAYAKECKEGK